MRKNITLFYTNIQLWKNSRGRRITKECQMITLVFKVHLVTLSAPVNYQNNHGSAEHWITPSWWSPPLYCCGICCRYNEAWRWWSNFNHGWLPNATNNPKIRFLQQAQQSARISTQQFARTPVCRSFGPDCPPHHNQGLLVFLGWVHLPTEIRTWSVLRCSNYPPASPTLLGTVVAMVRNPGN